MYLKGKPAAWIESIAPAFEDFAAGSCWTLHSGGVTHVIIRQHRDGDWVWFSVQSTHRGHMSPAQARRAAECALGVTLGPSARVSDLKEVAAKYTRDPVEWMPAYSEADARVAMQVHEKLRSPQVLSFFREFPARNVVPADHEILIQGICALEPARGPITIWHGEKKLFEIDARLAHGAWQRAMKIDPPRWDVEKDQAKRLVQDMKDALGPLACEIPLVFNGGDEFRITRPGDISVFCWGLEKRSLNG